MQFEKFRRSCVEIVALKSRQSSGSQIQAAAFRLRIRCLGFARVQSTFEAAGSRERFINKAPGTPRKLQKLR